MPRNGGTTRELLLDTAERLVERNGFAATSVEMILSESGSSKGAFFHHFPSKRALSHALVERYVAADLGSLDRGLAAASEEAEPAARLLRFLDYFVGRAAALTSESACLYIAVLVEQDLLDEENSAQVERAITGWREAVSALVRDAYAASPCTVQRPHPEDLAGQLFAVIEGAFLMCRAAGTPEPMRAQLLVYRQLVAALLGADAGGGARRASRHSSEASSPSDERGRKREARGSGDSGGRADSLASGYLDEKREGRP